MLGNFFTSMLLRTTISCRGRTVITELSNLYLSATECLSDKKGSRGSLGVLFKSVFRFLYRNAVIVVHGASSRRIAPVPGIVVVVFWRSLELVFGYAGTIAAKAGVVFQRLPRQRIIVIADA